MYILCCFMRLYYTHNECKTIIQIKTDFKYYSINKYTKIISRRKLYFFINWFYWLDFLINKSNLQIKPYYIKKEFYNIHCAC